MADIKVKMKVQTSYYGKNLFAGDTAMVPAPVAKRWHQRGIAILRKADVAVVLGKEVKKIEVDEFEDEAPIDSFENEVDEEVEADGTVHDLCDNSATSNVSGDSSGESANGLNKVVDKGKRTSKTTKPK